MLHRHRSIWRRDRSRCKNSYKSTKTPPAARQRSARATEATPPQFRSSELRSRTCWAFLGGFGNKTQGIEYKREPTARALMNETAPFPCGDGYYGGQIESKALALFSQRTVFVLTKGHPTAVKFTPFPAPPRSTPISTISMGPRGRRGGACVPKTATWPRLRCQLGALQRARFLCVSREQKVMGRTKRKPGDSSVQEPGG